MAAGGNSEKPTIPVKHESQKVTKNETGPLNIAELIILGTAAVGGWHILSFIYTEVIKFIKELGQ